MKTNREKVLATILPALFVVAIYAFWFAPKPQAELDKVEAEIKTLKAKGNPTVQLAQKGAKLNALSEAVERLRTEKGELHKQWEALAAGSGDPSRRSEKVERLTAVLKQYGLNVIEQAQAAGADSATPAALDVVTKKLAEGSAHKLQLWRFRVVGSYAELLGALKHLGDGEPMAIPLGLTMKEASLLTDVREWTLLMWI